MVSVFTRFLLSFSNGPVWCAKSFNYYYRVVSTTATPHVQLGLLKFTSFSSMIRKPSKTNHISNTTKTKVFKSETLLKGQGLIDVSVNDWEI